MFSNHIIRTGEKILITYALREHELETKKIRDYIAIRAELGLISINVPVEDIKKALNEFETGEELNVNHF